MPLLLARALAEGQGVVGVSFGGVVVRADGVGDGGYVVVGLFTIIIIVIRIIITIRRSKGIRIYKKWKEGRKERRKDSG